MAQCLEIVTAGLLTTQMRVNTHVSGSSRQRLSLAVGDMLLRLGIAVLLRHSKIHNMDNIGCLGAGASNQEVVRLDITVNEVLLVNRLYSGKLEIDNRC